MLGEKTSQIKTILQSEAADKLALIADFIKNLDEENLKLLLTDFSQINWHNDEKDLAVAILRALLRDEISSDIIDQFFPVILESFINGNEDLTYLEEELALITAIARKQNKDCPIYEYYNADGSFRCNSLHLGAEDVSGELLLAILETNFASSSNVNSADEHGNVPLFYCAALENNIGATALIRNASYPMANIAVTELIIKNIIKSQRGIADISLIPPDELAAMKNRLAMDLFKGDWWVEYAAIENDDPELRTLCQSMLLLSLSYSSQGYGASDNTVAQVAEEQIIALAGEGKIDKCLSESARIVTKATVDDTYLFNGPDGRQIALMRCPFQTHAAFMLADFDPRTGNPVTLHYLDGNNIIDAEYGVTSFKVDAAKLEAFPGDISQIFSDIKYSTNEVKMGLARIVECDEDGNPIICKKSIKSERQKRGNCTLKSFNVAVREVASRNYGMDFDDKSTPDYATYKSYRKALIDNNINIFAHFIQNEEMQEYLFKKYPKLQEEVVKVAKQAFLKSVVKKDLDREEIFGKFLEKCGVDLLEVKNDKGHDVLFMAVTSGDLECTKRIVGLNVAKINNIYSFKPDLNVSLLNAAIIKCDVAMVNYLLKTGAQSDETSLDLAIKHDKSPAAIAVAEAMMKELSYQNFVTIILTSLEKCQNGELMLQLLNLCNPQNPQQEAQLQNLLDDKLESLSINQPPNCASYAAELINRGANINIRARADGKPICPALIRAHRGEQKEFFDLLMAKLSTDGIDSAITLAEIDLEEEEEITANPARMVQVKEAGRLRRLFSKCICR